MKKEIKGGRARKMALAVIGLTLGVVLMLVGGIGGGRTEGKEETEALSAEAYRLRIEEQVEALCRSIPNVGEVRVMVTLSGGYQYVYAKNERGDCITVGSGSSERAVVEEILSPRIVGVGVVCGGADDPAVHKRLVDLIASSLGIGANHVIVTAGQ